ncbi:MAG: Crp/Fnr family transcriptional regulator [Bacteroidia bacterium]
MKNKTTHCVNCMWKEAAFPSPNNPGDAKDKPIVNVVNHKFSKGDVLLKEKNYSNGFFCIKKGSVYTSKNSEQPENFILWHSNPGDVVGIESYVMKEKLGYSAYAANNVSACFVSLQDIERPGYEFPETLIKLTKSICNLINSIEKK